MEIDYIIGMQVFLFSIVISEVVSWFKLSVQVRARSLYLSMADGFARMRNDYIVVVRGDYDFRLKQLQSEREDKLSTIVCCIGLCIVLLLLRAVAYAG